jgi:hypothetical protein
MFNTYHNHPREMKVTSHEHRAPTTQSVRLLDEMRREALESIIAHGVEHLPVNTLAWDVAHDVMRRGFGVWISVTILDKPCKGEIFISDFDLMRAGSNPDAWCKLVGDKLTDEVRRIVHDTITDQLFRGAASLIAMNIEKTRKKN